MSLIISEIGKLNINDYDYVLPEDRIATHPFSERSSSRLLFADSTSHKISHHHFSDIIELLPEGSILVLNKTKVIPARLLMKKTTGGIAEILCIDPILPSKEPEIAMSSASPTIWNCMIGGQRIKPGTVLIPRINDDEISLKAKIIDKKGNKAEVEFSWDPPEFTFSQVLEKAGKTPLPPYIKRQSNDVDKHRYQTVYAKHDGSVAAPTAGLHFSDEILSKLSDKFINTCELTLHVGPGTFQPVATDDVSAHTMHSERISIDSDNIDKIINFLKNRKPGSRLIATGTTSLRTLESLYWLGVKLKKHSPEISQDGILRLDQWEPYRLMDNNEAINPVLALEELKSWMDENSLKALTAETSVFIVPGYEFKLVDALITNYHLPKSTLILLVAAFVGNEFWREIYNEALINDYRFLSYGDSSLLFR
jgi:S-adenosylmethionine:tRNA ribosyltransferase-isomerase